MTLPAAGVSQRAQESEEEHVATQKKKRDLCCGVNACSCHPLLLPAVLPLPLLLSLPLSLLLCLSGC